MKIAHSLLLSLLLIHGHINGMMILPHIPTIVAAAGIAYIKVTGYFRDKRLDKIEGKIDRVSQNVNDLKDRVVGIEPKVDGIQYSLDQQQTTLRTHTLSLQNLVDGQEALGEKVNGVEKDIAALREENVANHNATQTSLDQLQKNMFGSMEALDKRVDIAEHNVLQEFMKLKSSSKEESEAILQKLVLQGTSIEQLQAMLKEAASAQENKFTVISNKLEKLMERTQQGEAFEQKIFTLMKELKEAKKLQNPVAQFGVLKSWQIALLACPTEKNTQKQLIPYS